MKPEKRLKFTVNSDMKLRFSLKMKRYAFLAVAASLIASAQILTMSPASSQEASSSKTINAKSLCGTWQKLPGSGGFHQLTASNGMLKGSGLDTDGDAITYTINDANLRTAIAIQTIKMEEGQAFHISDGFKTKAIRNLVGVTRQNVIMFTVQGETSTEIWTPLTPSTYEVAGIETGPHAMAYHLIIKQTSKSSCKTN
jgi:hypothetical protein